MSSRAYALNLHWSTAPRNGNSGLRAKIFSAAQAHLHPDHSWRARRLYREIADWMHERDPRKARAVVTALPHGRSRAYLERRFGNRQVRDQEP